MAATYEVGTKVKVTVDEAPYAGTIITYEEVDNETIYKVSVDGIGQVITATDDDLETL